MPRCYCPPAHSPRPHLTYNHQNCTCLCRHLTSGTYSAEDRGRLECRGIHRTSTHTLHLQSINDGIWWTQTHFFCSLDNITLNCMFYSTSQSSPTVRSCNWLYYPLSVSSPFISQFPCPYLYLWDCCLNKLFALKSLFQSLFLGEPN